jgi:hypothetical protein
VWVWLRRGDYLLQPTTLSRGFLATSVELAV